MGYAPKIVLELPISDTAMLEPFVEACIRDKVRAISVVGSGCEKVEHLIDDIIVGRGEGEDRFMLTSSHPGESLEDVLQFASCLAFAGTDDKVELVRL